MLSSIYLKIASLEWKTLFSFFIKVGFLLLCVLLVTVIYRGLRNDNYVLQPLAVPKKYVDAGYSGAVMANHIQDRIIEMKNQAQSIKNDSMQIEVNQTPDLNMQIMGLGLSSNSLSYHVRDIMGIPSKLISGELTDIDNTLKLTLRMTGLASVTYVEEYEDGPREALESIIDQAAQRVLYFTDPYRLAVLKFKTEKLDEAEEIIREIIETRPNEAKWAYLAWGNLKKKRGDRSGAIAMYEKSLEHDPDFALPNRTLGWERFRDEDYANALAYFDKSIASGDENFGAYNGKALCHTRLGESDQAKAAYEKNIEIFPKLLYGYANYSDYLINVAKDTAASMLVWDRAKINVEKGADYYLAMSGQYFFSKNIDSVKHYLNIALDYDPDHIGSLQTMANYLFYSVQNHQEAEHYFRDLARCLKEQNFESSMLQNAYNMWAMNDYKLMKYDSSIYHAQIAISIDTTIAIPYTSLAECYSFMGNDELFYKNIEKAMQKGFRVTSYMNEEPYVRYADRARMSALIEKYEKQQNDALLN